MTGRRRGGGAPLGNDASDGQLVDAARSGDAEAMGLLLRRHFDRVHAVCRRIAGSTRDADDAAQEAMIRVVRNLERFDGRSSFGTWVYRVATNTALDELRRRRRQPQLHVVTHDDDGDHVPSDIVDTTAHRSIDAVADRLTIDGALSSLPDDFRIPVVLRDVADLDYAEIADVLDVPIGTVKSRIARGRRMLSEQLGNRSDAGERPTNSSPHPPDDQ